MITRLTKPQRTINIDNLSENELKDLVVKIAEKLNIEVNISE